MEDYKLLLFEKNYIRIRIDLSKNLPLTISVGNRPNIKSTLNDLVLPDDLPKLTDLIQQVSADNSELYTHFRVHYEREIYWFLICAQVKKDKLSMKAPYLIGQLINVSRYIDNAIDDLTLLSMQSRVEKNILITDFNNFKLTDIVGKEYLEQLQIPFKLSSGIFSAIYDCQNNLIATPCSEGGGFNPANFKHAKTVDVTANHRTIGKWMISANKKEVIMRHEEMLDIMNSTLSRIINALVLLHKEMINSERTNKMLSENIEQQMLINSVYNEIFSTKNTGEIIDSVLKIIGQYLKIDAISIYGEDEEKKIFKRQFIWTSKKFPNEILRDNTKEIGYDKMPYLLKQLDFTDYYYPTTFTHEFNFAGLKHYMAVNLSGDGKRYGIVVYGIALKERLPTAEEAKMLKSISQILASLILKYNTDLKLQKTSERVSYLAYNDPVLDTPNRAKLDMDLKEEFKCKKEGAIIYIKVTNLRVFNELFGHSYTDQLLKGLTNFISELKEENAAVYRFSGNIMSVLLSGSDALRAKNFSEKIIKRFKKPWVQDGNEHYLDSGIGIALYPHNGKNCDELYRALALSMYRAIEYGVNSYAFYSKEFEKPVGTDYFYAEKLRQSIHDNMKGFYLKYQPIVNLKTGISGSAEVFVNWENGKHSLDPSKIIRLAETIGFDIKLDKWVINEACAYCRMVQKKYSPEFSVSVNITSRELQSGTIVSMVNEALRQSGLKGEYLSIEISERVLLNTRENIIPVINRLRESGVKIVIDSFGRDFMPSGLLKYSNINMIKADFTIFTNVFDEFDEILLDAAVRIANTMPDGICIKRVENQEQLEILDSYDINYLQGYLYSRPLSSDELIAFMSEKEKSLQDSYYIEDKYFK